MLLSSNKFLFIKEKRLTDRKTETAETLRKKLEQARIDMDEGCSVCVCVC